MSSTRGSAWPAVLVVSSLGACNYTEGECRPRGQGGEGAGVGGGVIVLNGAGGFGDVPPDPQGPTDPPACNVTEQGDAGDGEPDEASLKVFCAKPDHGAICSARCAAKGVACGALAGHPYTPSAGTGQLFSCNTLLIGVMCGYHYPNGDDCYFPIGAPWPNVCSYSGND